MTKVRERECSCGHKWTAPVEMALYTSNLSGEAKVRCPKCNGADGAFVISYPTQEKDVTEKLIIPLVHINGSGEKNLTDGFVQAARAINDAMVKVCEAYPHMRDYYPLDNSEEIFKQAQAQHYARIDKLREVATELNALALGVYNQR